LLHIGRWFAFVLLLVAAGWFGVRLTHSAGSTNQVLFLGDSIMAGNHLPDPDRQSVPALVAAAVPEIGGRMRNLAIGSTYANEDPDHTDGGQGATADALYRADVDLNIDVVLFGANDLAAGFDAARFTGALETYVAKRRAAGFKVIVLTTLPNIAIDRRGAESQRRAANITTLKNRLGWDGLGDLAADVIMGSLTATSDSRLYSDGVHPTPLGTLHLAAIAADAVRALVPTPH
jgi:lysophospholipase L1-like esterase